MPPEPHPRTTSVGDRAGTFFDVENTTLCCRCCVFLRFLVLLLCVDRCRSRRMILIRAVYVSGAQHSCWGPEGVLFVHVLALPRLYYTIPNHPLWNTPSLLSSEGTWASISYPGGFGDDASVGWVSFQRPCDAFDVTLPHMSIVVFGNPVHICIDPLCGAHSTELESRQAPKAFPLIYRI